jgi:hypothetical protein
MDAAAAPIGRSALSREQMSSSAIAIHAIFGLRHGIEVAGNVKKAQ